MGPALETRPTSGERTGRTAELLFTMLMLMSAKPVLCDHAIKLNHIIDICPGAEKRTAFWASGTAS
jgi:hypothetical protein